MKGSLRSEKSHEKHQGSQNMVDLLVYVFFRKSWTSVVILVCIYSIPIEKKNGTNHRKATLGYRGLACHVIFKWDAVRQTSQFLEDPLMEWRLAIRLV
jgi:hypothetical protein